MLTGFLRNVVPQAPPRPAAFCERIFTLPLGWLRPEDVHLVGLVPLGTPEPPGLFSECKQVGARWPDDSVRFLRAEFWAKDLGGNEARAIQLDIMGSEPPKVQWMPSDWIPPAAFFRFSADGVGHQSENWIVKQTTHLRIVMTQLVRFGPGGSWWAECEYDAIHALDSTPFRVRVGWQDPRVPDMATTLLSGMQMDVNAPVLIGLRNGAAHAASVQPHVGQPGYSVRLLGPGTIADAQGIALRGVICYLPPELVEAIPTGFPVTPETAALALGQLMKQGLVTPEMPGRIMGNVCELETSVRAVQTGVEDGWAPSPLPFLPATPPWVAADAGKSWASANSGPLFGPAPFQAPRLGHIPEPEGTGSQADLGLQRWEPMVARPDPMVDETIARSVEFEAGRPSHFREVDGSDLWLSNHPQLRIWNGRPHFSPSESPDRLGKGISPLPPTAGGLGERGWEHFTINYAFAGWLTGDRLCESLLNDLGVLWAASAKGLVPQSFLNSPGAARHTARFIWSGVQLFFFDGSQRLLDLCRWRADAAKPQTGPVGTVLAVRGPAANFLPTRDSWIAYEESDAAVTLYALAQIVRPTNPADADRYEALAWQILRMVVRFGYSWQNGVPVPATAVAWNSGVELTPEQLADTSYRTLFPGSDYQWWILPGVLLARSLSKEGGPHPDAAIHAEADRIATAVLAQRRPTVGGMFDDKGGWTVSVPQAEQS